MPWWRWFGSNFLARRVWNWKSRSLGPNWLRDGKLTHFRFSDGRMSLLFRPSRQASSLLACRLA
jgi:hypothetical protein